jgi:translation elongation factor EF-Ts
MQCETDFVAKTDHFVHGLESVLTAFHDNDEYLFDVADTQKSKDSDLINNLCKNVKLLKPLDTDLTS